MIPTHIAERLAPISEKVGYPIGQGTVIISMAGERGEDHEGREFLVPPPALGKISAVSWDSCGKAIFDVSFRVPPEVFQAQGDPSWPASEDTHIDILACLSEDQITDPTMYRCFRQGQGVSLIREILHFDRADELARPLGLSYGNKVIWKADGASIPAGTEGFISSHIMRGDPDKLIIVIVRFPQGDFEYTPADLLRKDIFDIRPVELISGPEAPPSNPEEPGSDGFGPGRAAPSP